MLKKINKNKFSLILIIFVLNTFMSIQKFSLLSEKYFYDSNGILGIMKKNIYNSDKSYNFAAKFFNSLNFFHLSTLMEWSIFITIVFTLIIIYFLSKNDKYNLSQNIFIIASLFLLNIYVFTLSKDIIQFTLFIFAYIILLSKLKNSKKILLLSLLFCIEGFFFRTYYFLISIMIITIYFIYLFFINDNNKNKILKIILWSVIFFFIEVYILQLISFENYITIMKARASTNMYRDSSIETVTIFNDYFGENNNYIIFIMNYLLNFFRFAFPIELINKGIKYLPFVIYQMFISINVLKFSKKIDLNNILWLILIISYFMTAVIFEPDFGSFIRHESSLFLIFLQLLNFNKKEEKIC